jgi:hypothetical protein
MKAPPARSLAQDGTALERRLLESARSDAIPAASLERLARALSVPTAAPVGLQPSISRLARDGSLVKLGAWGLIGAMAVTTAAQRWLDDASVFPGGSAPAEKAPAETNSPAAPVVEVSDRVVLETSDAHGRVSAVAAAAPADAPPPLSIELGAEPVELGASARHARSVRASRRHSAPPEERSDVHEARGLRAELSAVESVQRALRAGQISEAERGLAAYSRRFPSGELALEAELLRVDLDAARGDLDRARAHARTLLARPGAARYRARLEALTRDRTD